MTSMMIRVFLFVCHACYFLCLLRMLYQISHREHNRARGAQKDMLRPRCFCCSAGCLLSSGKISEHWKNLCFLRYLIILVKPCTSLAPGFLAEIPIFGETLSFSPEGHATRSEIRPGHVLFAPLRMTSAPLTHSLACGSLVEI